MPVFANRHRINGQVGGGGAGGGGGMNDSSQSGGLNISSRRSNHFDALGASSSRRLPNSSAGGGDMMGSSSRRFTNGASGLGASSSHRHHRGSSSSTRRSTGGGQQPSSSPQQQQQQQPPTPPKQIEPPQQQQQQQQQQPQQMVEYNNKNEIGINDEDSTRHESPPNRLRAALDVVNQIRYQCGTIVNNESVQFFIVCLIGINAVMMGLATFDFVKDNPEASDAFETTDRVFLIIFTIELAMQFIFHGWRLLLDGWLVFDSVVIMTSWFFTDAQIVRAFRIFRALRLVTRIEVMKNLVIALFGVMPRMGAIGILLFLVSYIFAVMFTQLFKDLWIEGYLSEDYFGRMDYTFFTLFQIMTFDSWSDITREVMQKHKWAWFPFVAFVIITGFIVVNLIIAVICDAISALNDDEKAQLDDQAMEHQHHQHGHGGGHEEEYSDEEDDDSYASEFDEIDRKEEETKQYLTYLEGEVEDLKRAQMQTLYTLEYLAGQLRANREHANHYNQNNTMIGGMGGGSSSLVS